LNTIPWTLASNVWNFGDGGSDITYEPSHTYTVPGAYPVTVVVTDSIGCEDSISKTVYVLQLNITSFNDTTLCISMPLPLTNVLTVIPDITLSYLFQWSPGTNLSDSTVQIPTYSGLGLTTYTLTASVNPYGCPVTDTIRIFSVLGKVLANVTPSTTITLGSSIQLNADSEVYYWWKPNDGSLNNPNINDPIATPTESTLYTVYGYDVNGCLDSAYVDILVDSSMDEGLPEAFTPNGDGLNDFFKPIGQKFQRLVDFRIYNRWGQQVFYSNNFNQGWDGTFNGVPQEMGVYFYSITVARPGGDGTNIVYKGEVTLIR
jgi:gliding motility-associated-like protein